jgi:RNA polymerase sigma-70 factor (ECF subfamily)
MSAQPEQQTGNQTRQFFQEPTAAGWEHFVERYGPKIYDWCRQRLRLAPALAEDVAQTVVVNLFQKMQAGRAHWDPAKGRLHDWLRTVVRNACHDAQKKHRPTVELQEWDRVCADFAEQFADAELLRLAQERAQARVSEKEWQVFRLAEIEGLAGEQVAAQTGVGVGTVYNYASRVRKVLQEELTKLEGAGPQ